MYTNIREHQAENGVFVTERHDFIALQSQSVSMYIAQFKVINDIDIDRREIDAR